MKTALVFGANGYIGKKLCASLESKGIRVKRYTRESCGPIEEFNEYPSMFKGVDTIFQLASTTHNYHILNDDCTIDECTNIFGNQLILEMMKSHCPKAKMVYVSTFFTNFGEPKGLYGASKLCAEQYCKVYSNVFNLDISIARLSNVYGEGEDGCSLKKGAFNKMVQMLCEDENLKVYKPSPRRDFIHVDDVVKAIQIVGNKGLKGEDYDVCTGQSIQISTLLEFAQVISNSKAKIMFVATPDFHSKVGLGDWESNPKKLRDLGWDNEYDVVEGIKKLVKSYKDNIEMEI